VYIVDVASSLLLTANSLLLILSSDNTQLARKADDEAIKNWLLFQRLVLIRAIASLA
jgi:hypothetical protein